jgi:4a-hydroxytetrahydrobiopterin dehydratase
MSADAPPPSAPLTDEEVERELETRHGWRRDGIALVRELHLRDFEEALRLVEHVAQQAVDHFRRPDMCILEGNRVRLIVENRHHAGITLAELRLAEKVSAVLDRPGAG